MTLTWIKSVMCNKHCKYSVNMISRVGEDTLTHFIAVYEHLTLVYVDTDNVIVKSDGNLW
jgi:hypothetical protein